MHKKPLLIFAINLGAAIVLFAGSIMLQSSWAEAPQVTQSDVRVLIDVSGSMKKNDPKNLRIPALQLLTNIMPPKSKAGVWAFGKYVNMLVPHRVVDDKWKEIANQKAPTIKSNALFTNIGEALTKAKYNWKDNDPKQKRSILLLTDGVVDISKDEFVNAKERLRILKEILPELKKAKVSVHTIALSKNADQELLQRLSADTDGLYHLVEDASELTPVFLKIFDQATDRDTVPMTNNSFEVDKAVDEFTLLVFKKDNSPESTLISPSKKQYTEKQSSKELAWFADENFDLITIRSPEAGKWQVKADLDPLNRVMVVSDLSLHLERLPNNLLTNESLTFKTSLLEDKKLIKRKNFLSLTTIGIELSRDKEKISAIEALDDGQLTDEQAGDGVFTANVSTGAETGKIDVQVVAESPTFKRMKRFQLNVYGSPFDLNTIVSDKVGINHQIEITPKEEVISTKGIQISAMVSMPDGQEQTFIPEDLGSIRKVLRIPVVEAGGKYIVKMNATGKTIINRDFDIALPEYSFEQKSLVPEPEPVQEPPPTPEPEAKEKEPEPEPEVEKEPTEEGPTEEEGKGIMFWAAVGLAGNLVLGLLIWLVMRMLKKSSNKAVDQLKEELGVDGDQTEVAD